MILSDHSIRNCIENGTITVTPEPDPVQYQPASLDVRIDNQLYNVETDRMRGHLTLEPGVPYLGSTEEYIELPDDVAAQLAGRSSVGRRGVIIHKTAGWIDPGFEGQLTLELYNFGSEPVTFDPGQRIGQLVFFELDYPSEGYDGQYQCQTGPTRSGEL